jgi:hypothetical protein
VIITKIQAGISKTPEITKFTYGSPAKADVLRESP